MSDDGLVLLADEAPIAELDELRPLIAEGMERGVLTFAQIAACLEEVEVTKEQVQELHAYLDEQGIEVVGEDGRLAKSEGGSVEASAVAAVRRPGRAAQEGRGRPHGRALARLAAALPALDRAGVSLLTAEQEVPARAAHRARRHGWPSSR